MAGSRRRRSSTSAPLPGGSAPGSSTHVGIPNASDAVADGAVVDEDVADRLDTLGEELVDYAAIGRLPELREELSERAEVAELPYD